MDTTFVIDAKKNCLLLSGTTPVNIRSIMVGVDSPNVFIPQKTYQMTLSGSAASGPFAGLEMPGVFVHYGLNGERSCRNPTFICEETMRAT